MGSRACLDVLEEKQICCLRREYTPLHHVQRGTLDTSLKVKVKCTPVQALRLCTGRTAHRGSRGIAVPLYRH